MDTRAKSLMLRYVGERFNGGRMPLDVLPDLKAFRDLLVAYAKEIWKERNTSRARLPKGFDKSISFDLVGVEDGSAVPKLEWKRDVAQQYLPDFTDEIEDIVAESYDSIRKLVAGAANDQYPSALGSEQVRALNRLGAGLQENEQIQFWDFTEASTNSQPETNIIFLDVHRRKKLITNVRETYERQYEGFSRLLSTSIEEYIEVESSLYGKMKIPIDKDRVLAEFQNSLGEDVYCVLQIELDQYDRFRKVVGVIDVEIGEGLGADAFERLNVRIKELSSLKDGWYNGLGVAPTAAATKALQDLLSKRGRQLAESHIFPTEHGGYLVEFLSPTWDVGIEFDARGHCEIYGIGRLKEDELETQSFLKLNSQFLDFFDQLWA